MNFIQRVITIPEKLTTLATAGILYLIVQFEIWFAGITGIDFAGVFQPLAVILAAILTMLLKVLLEKVIPESWHPLVNSFLAWLASIVAANFLFQALL